MDKSHNGITASKRQLLAYSALFIFGAGTSAAISLMEPAAREVITPAFVTVFGFALFTLVLFFQTGHAPLFHAGFFAASTALIYIALPPIFFVLSGMEWSETSDQRLLLLHINEDDVAGYVWRGALYLYSFCATYVLAVWTLPRYPAKASISVTRVDLAVCMLVAAGGLIYKLAVETAFGISLSQSNADFINDPASQNLPLFIAQMTHNILAIQQIAKLALVVALISLWQNRWARLILAVLLLWELVSTLTLLGPRTYFALLLLAAFLAFHRMVRPVSMPLLGAAGALFLFLLLTYGYFRDYSNEVDFSSANEFQILMGTALHMRDMIANGLIVPPQVTFSEALMLIPQQILPIEKIDPSTWYLVESGYIDSGSGFMFGVQSQAEVGRGNVELVFRAIALALVLGVIHRHYIRRPPNFLLTVSYIWLITIIYYSYRAATFYWITYAVFRLLVFVGIFLAMRHILLKFVSCHHLSGIFRAEK